MRPLLSLALLTCLLTGCAPTTDPLPRPLPVTLLAPDPTLLRNDVVNAAHRADGTVTVDGRPLFPLGFYHISWAAGGTIAQRRADVCRLGASGFNLMATEPINDEDVATYRDFLDLARQCGVYVLSYGLKTNTVNAIKSHPAVLGFKLADDSNALVSPGEVRKRNLSMKKLAPDKLTYISLSVGYNRPETPYFGTSDLVGNQSYPVGNDDINVTYRVMRSAVQSALAQRSVPIANLQTFSWGKGKPLPSPAELRNMTYQAVMAGVKGILYYAYRSQEVDLNREPRLWGEAQALAREIALLSPALLESRRTELSSGNGKQPVVVVFQGTGGHYLLALNNSRRERQKVSLALPGRPDEWRSVSGRPSALRVSGVQVTGELAPLEVAVYRLRDRPLMALGDQP